MPVSQAVLVQCPLFADMPPLHLGAVAERMQLQQLRRREVVGGPQGFQGLGVVLSGMVQAVEETADGREVVLSTVDVNQPFGLAELLAELPLRPTWVAAAAGTAVGVLESGVAREVLKRPEQAWRVACNLAQRLCDTQALQKILSIHSVPARLAAWLLWQCGGHPGVLALPTHAELAWRLNTTRESVTRVLQRLSVEGIVQRDGEVWRIDDAQRLAGWGHAGA